MEITARHVCPAQPQLDVTDERTAEVLFNMLLIGREIEIEIDGFCMCVYIHRENESNVYLGSKVGQ